MIALAAPVHLRQQILLQVADALNRCYVLLAPIVAPKPDKPDRILCLLPAC